jgi:predicted lipoprotein
LRQVQALLAQKDPAATDPKGLRAKSVALQGLNALEFVLFGSDAGQLATAEGAYACRFGAAITANIAAETAAIAAGWQAPDGIAGAMLDPKPTNPAYRSLDDSLQEIAGIFIHGLEATRDLRLNPALGASIEKANPKTLIYPRAGLAKASLQANIAGLAALYDASRIASLLPAKQNAVGAAISAEFEKADGLFAGLVVSLPDAVGNPAERPRVEEILALTHSLERRFAEQLAPALGLSAGFSSLDGD